MKFGSLIALRLGDPVEAIVLDLRLERTIGILAPIGNELVERDRVHHRARQDMRADFRSLLDHHHRKFGVELLQPDGGAKPGRPGADDHDVEFHGFARRQFFGAHGLISGLIKMRRWDVCFRFSREEQPWKCRLPFRCSAIRPRVGRSSASIQGAFAMRNFKTKAIRDQQVDA